MEQERPRHGRNCLLCSTKTIKSSSFLTKRAASFINYIPSKLGLTCTKCQSFACKYCIVLIHQSIEPKLRANDQWCQDVRSFLSKKPMRVDFVGHCCEFAVLPRCTQDVQSLILPCRYDGCLFFPEYGVLVDTCFESVDVFAFGPDIGCNLKGLWHSVVDYKTARMLEKACVKPDGSKAVITSCLRELVHIQPGDKLVSKYVFVSIVCQLFNKS